MLSHTVVLTFQVSRFLCTPDSLTNRYVHISVYVHVGRESSPPWNANVFFQDLFSVTIQTPSSHLVLGKAIFNVVKTAL